MDVADISPGLDFRQAIDDNVASCGVLLAVIGPQWVTATDRSGKRRIDDESDFVRLETASALAREIPVIPVLIHGATMPLPDQLPENLKGLAYRNNVEITHARWNSDVQLLTTALRRYVGPTTATDTQPVHATVPVQLPPPGTPVQKSTAPALSRSGMILGVSASAVLLLGLAGFFAFHRSPDSSADHPAQAANGMPSASPAASGTTAAVAVPQPGNATVTSPVAPGKTPATTEPVRDANQQPAQAAAATVPAPSPGSRAAIQSVAGPNTSSATGASAIVGRWADPVLEIRNDNTLARLEITSVGNRVSMHAWGACSGCNWGSQPATVNGQSATAVWDVPQDAGRVATVTVSPEGSGLAVQVANSSLHGRHNARNSHFERSQ